MSSIVTSTTRERAPPQFLLQGGSQRRWVISSLLLLFTLQNRMAKGHASPTHPEAAGRVTCRSLPPVRKHCSAQLPRWFAVVGLIASNTVVFPVLIRLVATANFDQFAVVEALGLGWFVLLSALTVLLHPMRIAVALGGTGLELLGSEVQSDTTVRAAARDPSKRGLRGAVPPAHRGGGAPRAGPRGHLDLHLLRPPVLAVLGPAALPVRGLHRPLRRPRRPGPAPHLLREQRALFLLSFLSFPFFPFL